MAGISYGKSFIYILLQSSILAFGNAVMGLVFYHQGFDFQNPLSSMSKAVVVFTFGLFFNSSILFKMLVDAVSFGINQNVDQSKDINTVDDN